MSIFVFPFIYIKSILLSLNHTATYITRNFKLCSAFFAIHFQLRLSRHNASLPLPRTLSIWFD